MKRLLLIASVLVASPALAQQGSSFVLTDHTFNQGGRPLDGTTAASPNLVLSLDAIGSGLRPAHMAGSFFTSEGGFVATLAPPGEVERLRFDSKVAMVWDPDARGLAYNVYRGTLATSASCNEALVAGTSHTATGTPGAAWFYLVTSVNGVAEESTRGFGSNGTERPDVPACF